MAISLGELATRFACDLKGDPDVVVDEVAALSSAGPGSLSFLANSALKEQLSSTKAAAVILRADDADDCPVACLIDDNPYAAFARVAALIHPMPAIEPGVHASAVVDSSANIAASAQVDALSYVGARTEIGEDVYVGPGCIIGPDCVIGDGSRLVGKVSIPKNVRAGKRLVVHPGVVIGSDGFGNAMTPEGWVKVPQIGGVLIGDDVEIGANSTIDCGAIGDTIIEDGVRIDNQCMIAHNVRIGAHTAMASMTGVAGSTTVGKRCMFAGKVGTVGHINICDDVVVSGRGTVSKDITEPGVYAGTFTVEKASTWNRMAARLKRIDKLYDRVRKLEKGKS